MTSKSAIRSPWCASWAEGSHGHWLSFSQVKKAAPIGAVLERYGCAGSGRVETTCGAAARFTTASGTTRSTPIWEATVFPAAQCSVLDLVAALEAATPGGAAVATMV